MLLTQASAESVQSREIFERELERVRQWYGCFITGYVVIPEHVPPAAPRFVQFEAWAFLLPSPVWSEQKRVEKLGYIHRNPVRRGLVQRPENWKRSSLHHHSSQDSVDPYLVAKSLDWNHSTTSISTRNQSRRLRARFQRVSPFRPPSASGN